MKRNQPVLLINLENRPERLIHTLSELRKVNMNEYVTRIEACNEQYAKDKMFQYITNRAFQNIRNIQNTMIIPNFRALACAISHIKCWKFILKNQYNGCFITEDDIVITKPEEFQFEIEQVKKLIKNSSNKSKDIFLTFNSTQIRFNPSSSYNYIPPNYIPPNYINYNFINTYNYTSENNLELINNPIIGTHFYYLSKGMAKYLIDNLEKITYQIDIEIGLLSGKVLNNMRKHFINLKTNSIKQSNKFQTDIQYYNIAENEISNILNLPQDIANEIFKYIPKCFKKMRSKLYQPIKNDINNYNIENLINNNYYDYYH
jgi:GR25 family glycosyltransferase involved in LPS biosynthesis